jgi:pimeloyl-ACP methyl ester carboxylesterase
MDEQTPNTASNGGARPFRIEVPQARLDAICDRVRSFEWSKLSQPANGDDWRYGPPADFMWALCDYWATSYDWRVQERVMNAAPQFVADIDGHQIHFVHEPGSGATARPLLIMHGWPYSFHSYAHLVGRLAHPEQFGGDVADAFSVVIPSFPGYGFSSRPSAPLGPRAVAELFNQLMVETLGYRRYVAHGGDWGCYTGSLLGYGHPKHVAGVHVTNLTVRHAGAPPMTGETPLDAGPVERAFAKREAALWRHEGAYSRLHSTKPVKLAYAMADSPVGVAAWIVEAFHAWSDRRQRPFEAIFTRDQLLTEVMLYLVTDAFDTSTWLYAAQEVENSIVLPPGQRVEVPVALAAFPDPVFPMPPREVAIRSHNVVQYTEMPRGGHFPFYEQPDLLVDDLRWFSRSLAVF